MSSYDSGDTLASYGSEENLTEESTNLRTDSDLISTDSESNGVQTSQEASSENVVFIDNDTNAESVSNSEVSSESSPVSQQVVIDERERDVKCERSTESPELESCKKRRTSSSDEDEGRVCPICFGTWTDSGDHRVCSLKCGHLFGHSCLMRWLAGQPHYAKSCPSCKRKVKKNDVRFLFVKRLVALNTCEIDELKTQIQKATERRKKLTVEYSNMRCVWKDRLWNLQKQIAQLQEQLSNKAAASSAEPYTCTVRLHKEHSAEVDPKGGCRVFDFCERSGTLAVSTSSPNSLFSGWGVRKICVPGYRSTAFIAAHVKPIRDLAFRGARLLSVSLDCRAKLTDLHNNCELLSITCDSPLWSGCWDAASEHALWTGEARGLATLWDVRNARSPVTRLSVPEDFSPVVSLASVSAELLLCCKLNSCWMFEGGSHEHGRPLSDALAGPFMSLRYDRRSDQVLVSSRPNLCHPYTRHVLVRDLHKDEVSRPAVVVPGAPAQSKLTRSCIVSCGKQTLVAAHHETSSSITLWDVPSGRQACALPAFSPVLDLASITLQHETYLCSLTNKKLDFYKFNV